MRMILLLLTSCATLNTAGMTESCKRLYDACLNTCPGAAVGSPPTVTPDSTEPTTQTEVASCTSDCNERAKNCR